MGRCGELLRNDGVPFPEDAGYTLGLCHETLSWILPALVLISTPGQGPWTQDCVQYVGDHVTETQAGLPTGSTSAFGAESGPASV